MAQIVSTSSYVKDVIGLGANQAGTNRVKKDSIILIIWLNKHKMAVLKPFARMSFILQVLNRSQGESCLTPILGI